MTCLAGASNELRLGRGSPLLASRPFLFEATADQSGFNSMVPTAHMMRSAQRRSNIHADLIFRASFSHGLSAPVHAQKSAAITYEKPFPFNLSRII